MARSSLSVLLSAWWLTACVGPGDTTVGPVVRDSAGVRIVEYSATDAPLFELGPQATLTVGLEGGTEVPLYDVAGGFIDARGGIVIADAGNYRLARWSSIGESLSSFGGKGRGPGEFENITWIQAVGSEAALYDARSRRISWFDPGGGFLRSRPFALPRSAPPTDDAIVASGAALGVIGPSEVLAYAMAYADPVGEAGPLPVYADIHVFDTTAAPLRVVGQYMLVEWYEDPSIDGFPLANRLEPPRFHWSARDDLFAIAAAATHRIDILGGGSLRTVIREARSRIPFSPDSIPAEYQLAADSLQAYRDVRIDGQRRVWVKPAVDETEPTTRWRVFAENGDRLGDLKLPSDATVLDATGTVVLLLRRSDLDEESVELWDLKVPAR